MRPEITLGDTLYVPTPTSPLLNLHLRGKFPKGVVEQARSISKTVKVRKDTEIDVILGAKNGYDRKRKAITLSSQSLSPPTLNTLLPQLVGIHFWFNILTRKERDAYKETIKDIPDAKDPLKDFAVSFGRLWKGSLKQPRRKLLYTILVKRKGPFEPRDLPEQMNQRKPSPERRMPIPSTPFRPNPDSQFH